MKRVFTVRELMEITESQHGMLQNIIIWSCGTGKDLASGYTLRAEQFKEHLDLEVKRIGADGNDLIITVE